MAEGREPDRIGFFSFTRKATNEAIERASVKFKLARKDLKWFRTLHSLSYKWLGCTPTDIIQEHDFKEFKKQYGVDIGQSIHSKGSGDEDSGLHLIDLYRVRNTTLYEEFKKFGHVKGGFERLQRIDKNYRIFKKTNNIKDYTDLINEFVLQKTTPRLDIVIIDEVQDLKPSEWGIVSMLQAQAKAVYIAGDDDQAIFSWSGADVSKLIDLDCRTQVLNKSYRIPKSVFIRSNKLVDRITKRIPKIWTPRDSVGMIRTVPFESIDMSQGQWLVLTRTNYFLERVAEEVKRRGHLFEKNNGSSISPQILQAYRSWRKLQRQENVSYDEAKNLYQYMSLGDNGVTRGKKTLPGANQEESFNYQELCRNWGLNLSIQSPWDTVLTKITGFERLYIQQILDRGHDLDEKAKIKLSTIHGAKGGESQNVVLFSDLSYRISKTLWSMRDEERRVFYVGLTRAKENLYIVPSSTKYEFEEILS